MGLFDSSCGDRPRSVRPVQSAAGPGARLDRAGTGTRARESPRRRMTPEPTRTFDDTRPAAAPRVSVITPFLNAERFIAEAIESVLAQDFHDFELILIDDGSSRKCRDIARNYAVRYADVIRYVSHEGHVNRGISASRNLGVSLARGELVAFIDADDVWAPAKLSEQVAIMDAHPELGMVCGAARYWRSWNGGRDVIVPT